MNLNLLGPRPRDAAPPHRGEQHRVGDFQLKKVGISRYDLRDPYYTAVTASWGAFALGALALVLLLNLGFAALYVAVPGAVQNLRAGEFADAFFFSVETMSTVGYGVMAPVSFYGHVVATVEIVVGVVFTASLTGILFVRFSKPRARILFADVATVNGEGEAARLSIRIANGRQVLLTRAEATLSIGLLGQDEEGRSTWRTHQLELEQDRISLFPLTWTLEHRLAGSSPLSGFDAAAFEARNVKFYLMVTAYDPAIDAQVQQLQQYHADALVFGRRYADAIARDDDGRILADLARLSDLL